MSSTIVRRLDASILRRQLGAAILADWADWYGCEGIAQRRGSLGRRTTGVTDEWLERRMLGR
jgi:hypothetical protein